MAEVGTSNGNGSYPDNNNFAFLLCADHAMILSPDGKLIFYLATFFFFFELALNNTKLFLNLPVEGSSYYYYIQSYF